MIVTAPVTVIPYIELRAITLGPIWIPVFSLLGLVALGSGMLRGVWRAREKGVWHLMRGTFVLWIVAGGLTGAVLLKLVYYPYLFESQPLAEVFRFRGISSFGGVFGGLLGLYLNLARRGVPAREMVRVLDVAAYVVPFSWAIGRLGCALVHDHPGIRSDSWLAVRYPDWPRYDLGLLGMLFLILLGTFFRLLDRRPRPDGFFVVLACIFVGVFRFWMDRLQVDTPRYYGWSVDQINALLLLSLGLVFLPFLRNSGSEEAL